jgi:sigma-B regulation protein RsbU (phosphoserine phosphatase)
MRQYSFSDFRTAWPDNKMKPDSEKSKDELIQELQELRRRAAAVEKQRLEFKLKRYDQSRPESGEFSQRDQTTEALRMAQVIIDKSPVILFRRLAGDDPRLIYVSENIARFGYSADRFLSGQTVFKDIVHPDDSERTFAEIKEYARKNVEEYTQFYRIVTSKGDIRWVEDQTTVVRDAAGNKRYNQGIVIDITERRLAEEELRKSEEKFRRIVETTGEGFLMMDDDLKIQYANDAYCRMLGYQPKDILGKTPLDLATTQFSEFMSLNRERILARDYRKFEGSLVARNGRVVPVLIHGNTLRDSQGMKIGNVAFVADLTEQKKALALAGKVQRSLIPQTAPKIEGLDVAGRSVSCEEVGGDYFDFLSGPEYSAEKLQVVIGDVSGHGVDAALLMTSARAFIRTRAAQAGRPSQVVSQMNRDLALDMGDSGHFMTLFFIEIDPRHGTAHWVRAGHEPALMYKPEEDRFEDLVGLGLPLGVDKSFGYTDYEIEDLSAGTIIALGTDGIWEASDAGGHAFGKERFRQIVRASAKENSAAILQNVFDEVNHFSKGLTPHDDITLVVIKKV